jgi:HAD superfamily hydrolase (TIGR01549 family)
VGDVRGIAPAPERREWAPYYRGETWRSALETVDGDAGMAERLARDYIESQQRGHPLAPGATEFVRHVASSVPVVVVTNGPPDIQRLKLEQTGLADLVSAVVISGELGIGKPYPAVFRYALDTVGVAPDRAVMIGDSWERDVEGSLAAGVRPIWLSHGRVPAAADPRVTVASDLSGVTATLR